MITTYSKTTDLQTITFKLRTDEATGIVLVSVGEQTVEAPLEDANKLEWSLLEMGYTRSVAYS